ncbi:MAG: PEP-CTERM sorting domain-containing protein [Pirellulaceae bacterium]|nr:PEP-CTERM sorting domain-containing protein [Pirellulaceae bacterium]
MFNEGYLRFSEPGDIGGEERTGWIDIRHPANDGVNLTKLKDPTLGYDRSDFRIQVHNKIVTTEKSTGGGGPETATPNIARDYNYANEIWNQAGISVISTGQLAVDHSAGNNQGNPVVTTPVDGAGRKLIRAENRAADPVVNNWYVTSGILSSGGGLRGVSRGIDNVDHGVMVFNAAANDTFSHEPGHFLLNKHRFDNPDPDDTVHSTIPTDLMGTGGGFRDLPGTSRRIATLGPPDAAVGSPSPPALTDSGGVTVDRFADKVTLTTSGQVSDSIDQRIAAHASLFVQQFDNSERAANRADFDFIEDSRKLEQLGTLADNHDGDDFLVFETGFGLAPDHTGHSHPSDHELVTANLFGGTFRFVDVVSLFARYTDRDGIPSLLQLEKKILDYDTPQFSNNGFIWSDGTLVNVFDDGWTNATHVENFVARWEAPIDATMVRIRARATGDTAAQIDAVIAAPGVQGVGSGLTLPDPGPLPPAVDPNKNIAVMSQPGPGDSGPSRLLVGAQKLAPSDGGDIRILAERDRRDTVITLSATDLSAGDPLRPTSAYRFQFDHTLADGTTLGQLLQPGPELFVIQEAQNLFDIQYAIGLGDGVEFWQIHGQLDDALDATLANVFAAPLAPTSSASILSQFELTLDLVLDAGVLITDSTDLFTLTLSTARPVPLVPEPATTVMFLVGLATALRRRGHTRSKGQLDDLHRGLPAPGRGMIQRTNGTTG